MNYDEPFEIDFRPSVPAKVRVELNKLLRGTTRVIVSEDMAEGKTAKINAVRLNTKPGGYPSEPLEEIAEAVTAIMHLHWFAQETEDPDVGLPPMPFVICCEEPAKRGKSRPRTQFKYTYMGEREPDYAEDTMSIEDRAVHRVLELQERMLGQAYAHIADGHERLLRIVEQNTASSSAGAELLREAIPLFLSGTQQVLNARAMEYTAHRAAAQEEATTKRIESALKTLSPFLGIAAHQLAAKFGIQMQPPDASEEDDEDPEKEVPPESLAMVAQYFGAGLTNPQRAELNRILTRKQVGIFDALFCATTDDEAYAAYGEIAKHASDKLGALQAMLNPEQTQHLAAFMQGVAKHAAKKKTKPT